MPNEKFKKGRSLERAVRFIQETILKSDPKLQGAKFSIEVNKTVIISGVRHEIDVLIKTLPDSLYESVWIFECKNWDRTVGKNEPIIFTAKVNAICANRGFIVARKISKYAKAQLELDKRLSFVPCVDDFLSPLNSIELVHAVHEPQTVEVRVKQRGVPPVDPPNVVDWKGKTCQVNNVEMDFLASLKPHIDRTIRRDQKESAEKYQLDGTYSDECSELIVFDPNEFKIGDMEVEHMALTVRFKVMVHRRKVVSKFELKDQGQVFSFEPIEDFIPGKVLEVDVVKKF